jgi:hypothetical protein
MFPVRVADDPFAEIATCYVSGARSQAVDPQPFVRLLEWIFREITDGDDVEIYAEAARRRRIGARGSAERRRERERESERTNQSTG